MHKKTRVHWDSGTNAAQDHKGMMYIYNMYFVIYVKINLTISPDTEKQLQPVFDIFNLIFWQINADLSLIAGDSAGENQMVYDYNLDKYL